MNVLELWDQRCFFGDFVKHVGSKAMPYLKSYFDGESQPEDSAG